MSSPLESDPQDRSDLTQSGVTIPSDSENYDANNESSSPPSSSESPPLILYQPPTLWGLFRGAAINLVLPFINGLMLGFGELFAHELAFRLGWSGTKIFPRSRSSNAHVAGPGVIIQDDPVRRRRRNGEELDMLTSLE
ncbi:outer membrane protein Tom13 [Microthyrium microscopicum]|uniref:Outer membrane protein Tom13 n=1 Tax=Microthyrium microscopicum TaxID=703497 RepID=A0A6A6UNX6_9PEZI|nr:outer membrane protein Tom13 [Microthyrium microscopicum]